MSATATPVPASSALASRATQSRSTITSVAWVAQDDLELAEWTRAGQRLGVLTRCSPWWLGDWIRYGNVRFGQKYSRASAITGYDRQTLMNMVYVASRFEISRRREKLSWSHHEVVAALPEDRQEYWLDRAAAERLTRTDLRFELRARRRSEEDGSSEACADSDHGRQAVNIACPNCAHPIPYALFAAQLRISPPSGEDVGDEQPPGAC